MLNASSLSSTSMMCTPVRSGSMGMVRATQHPTWSPRLCKVPLQPAGPSAHLVAPAPTRAAEPRHLARGRAPCRRRDVVRSWAMVATTMAKSEGHAGAETHGMSRTALTGFAHLAACFFGSRSRRLELFRLHLHCRACVLELSFVPNLTDTRENILLLLPDMTLEARVHCLELREPGRLFLVALPPLFDSPFNLVDLGLMLLPPLRQYRVSLASIARERLIQFPVLDLLVDLQLGLQFGPEFAPSLRSRLQEVLERCLGLMMFLLEELDRIHFMTSYSMELRPSAPPLCVPEEPPGGAPQGLFSVTLC